MRIKYGLAQIKAVAVRVVGFITRHKRLSIAVAVALLIAGPLLTVTRGETFFCNSVFSTGQALAGLGAVALAVRRFVRARGRKQAQQANFRCQCHRQQQRTTQPAPQGQPQHQGGTP